MNKNEFIDVLEKSLIRLPKADRDDILSDYEAHFAIGVENGKTEEEVSASLGDPHELAMTYLENLPEGSKGAPAAAAADENSTADTDSTADAPAYSAPTYGAPKSSKKSTSSESSRSSQNSPDAGSIVLVVFLSIAAVFALFGVASVWVAIPCTAIGCFIGALALIALGCTIMTQSVLIGIGGILLSVALIAFGVLAVIACIASIKGIIWLVKQFIKLCKNILEGGSN